MDSTKTFTGYVIFKCYAHPEPVATRVHVGKNWELVNRAPVPCNDCGKMLPWKWGKMLYGVHSDAMKCDPRCWNAHGPDCTCQCGGMNHASGHDLKVRPQDVKVVEIPQKGIISRFSGYCEACGHAWLEGHRIIKNGERWEHVECPYYEIEHITTIVIDNRVAAKQP